MIVPSRLGGTALGRLEETWSWRSLELAECDVAWLAPSPTPRLLQCVADFFREAA